MIVMKPDNISIQKTVHMAYCGFDCGKCPIYIATAEDSDAMRETLAKKLSTPEKQLTKEDINCSGCKGDVRYINPFCNVCRIRCCAVEHGVGYNCGECAEYPCEEILAKIPADGESRRNLDAASGRKEKHSF